MCRLCRRARCPLGVTNRCGTLPFSLPPHPHRSPSPRTESRGQPGQRRPSALLLVLRSQRRADLEALTNRALVHPLRQQRARNKSNNSNSNKSSNELKRPGCRWCAGPENHQPILPRRVALPKQGRRQGAKCLLVLAKGVRICLTDFSRVLHSQSARREHAVNVSFRSTRPASASSALMNTSFTTTRSAGHAPSIGSLHRAPTSLSTLRRFSR
jgi:hypothetical protein